MMSHNVWLSQSSRAPINVQWGGGQESVEEKSVKAMAFFAFQVVIED